MQKKGRRYKKNKMSYQYICTLLTNDRQTSNLTKVMNVSKGVGEKSSDIPHQDMSVYILHIYFV
jgi:hypothetical protein